MIKTKSILSILFCLLFAVNSLFAQQAKVEEMKTGINFLETRVYSQEDDQKLLKLFEGLRVADISDGMDYVSLRDVGLVDPAIHALWKDVQTMDHVIRGIAVTARYVPAQEKRYPDEQENFDAWAGNWYNSMSSEAWAELIRPGSMVVLDDVESEDCGSIGSFNILAWYKLGAVGVVTDASSRDTDEIILQRIPLYLRKTGRGIRPGRNVLESVQRPVVIGGVTVFPGDVVVADGDGVIVVPRKVAKTVAEYAHGVLKGDKEARRNLYESMDRNLDDSVK